MSIGITKYVDTRSGVGGASAVRTRELMLRIISPSAALLPGEIREFSTIGDVGSIFALNTPEYRYAQKYFGFVSKLSSGARRLSMSRWNKSATAPIVQGAAGVLGAARLDALKAATELNLSINDGTSVSEITVTLDLSGAATYEAVRAAVQTALRAETNLQLTQANVLYTAATGVYAINGSSPVANSSITVVPAMNPAADAGALMGLLVSEGAKVIPSVPQQTALEAIVASADESDNFGSFGFIDSTSNPPLRLSDEDVDAIAAWNHSQNNKFLFLTPGTVAQAPARYEVLKGFSGTGYVISGPGDDFAEFCPAEVFASTDYGRPNASSNYMYQVFGNRTAQVTSTQVSDNMDAVRANYIGQTQTAGQKLAFFQRGVLMGDSTAAVDMNVYCNEIWFKDSIATSVMNAFIGLPRIPANDTGRALLLTNMQATIDTAILNGTISVGKTLDATQKSYITLMTDDPDAWQQITNIGYWVDITIRPVVTVDGRTEYVAQYLLLYSKDDQIRKVEGTDTLI